MITQKSFNYQFIDDHNENNFFVNKTNYYAFNGLINNDFNFLFLHGPQKSGKTFLVNTNDYPKTKINHNIPFVQHGQ